MRNVSFQIIVRHKMHFPKNPVNKCVFRNAFLAVRRQPYKSWCPPLKEEGQNFKVNSELSYQNKSCSECQQDVRKYYVNMSVCQYVNMSVCQYVRMQLFSLGIKMKVVQNVIRMSDSQYVNMSICQYVRMLLFSLGIKMKVVHNVIMMSDSQKISSQKISTDS